MPLNIKGGNQLPAPAKPEPKPEVKAKEESSTSSLKSVLAAIAKEKGDKVFTKAKDVPLVSRIPTGIFEFDLATGGGFPRARYSIVYGPESSGKTNVCYCAVSQAQKLPGPCNKVVWMDVEGTFDPAWAQQFGIDTDALIVVRPAYGEEAVDLIDALVRADDVVMVVMDSLAALIGIKEVEQSAEKFDVGTSPLLTKRMVNKLVMALSAEEKQGHTPAVVLINQTRMQIGVMFGNPEKMPGGKAMLFYSCLTVRVSGKNKVNKALGMDIPAFKETTAEIKKAKVQITRTNFEYDMCLLPHDGLAVGETDSWNSVSTHLKSMGALAKPDAKGWTLFDMTYPTLVYYQDKYASEPEFALKCQAAIIAYHSRKGFLLESKGDGES